MSYLDRIRACQVFDPAAYLPFRVDGALVGYVKPAFAETLGRARDVFRASETELTLALDLVGCEARTEAIGRALRALAEDKLFAPWRDEPYPVATRYGAPVLFHMERAAVPLFGIRAHGIHVNGFVRTDAGLEMWIGRRSPDKHVAPNRLDQLVAGGQPAGLGLRENLAKEGAEEASLEPALAARARPVGAVTYCTERAEGLRRDALFVYDLELPANVQPRNADGEIAEFYLWPMERVMETVSETDDFKFNCSLVVIDFLVRHGYIEPDHPDYLEIATGLRSG